MKDKRGPALLVFLVLLALAFGCAPRVAVKKPQPPEPPLAGGKTLAIGDISGELGRELAQTLASILTWEKGMVVASPDKAELILSGQVDLTLEDVRGYDLVQKDRKTGQKKKVTLKDPFVEREFTVSEPVYETVVEEVPFVYREADLSLTYILKNQNGEVVQGPEKVSVDFRGKFGGVNEVSRHGAELDDLISRRKTINRLISDLAEKTAARLAPASTTVNYVLDSGEGLLGEATIRRGVKLAQAGEWEKAVEAWNKVLDQDPDNPAAWYNLGVAYERLGGLENLNLAMDMYAEAARKGNKNLYRRALSRVIIAVRQLKKAEAE